MILTPRIPNFSGFEKKQVIKSQSQWMEDLVYMARKPCMLVNRAGGGGGERYPSSSQLQPWMRQVFLSPTLMVFNHLLHLLEYSSSNTILTTSCAYSKIYSGEFLQANRSPPEFLTKSFNIYIVQGVPRCKTTSAGQAALSSVSFSLPKQLNF